MNIAPIFRNPKVMGLTTLTTGLLTGAVITGCTNNKSQTPVRENVIVVAKDPYVTDTFVYAKPASAEMIPDSAKIKESIEDVLEIYDCKHNSGETEGWKRVSVDKKGNIRYEKVTNGADDEHGSYKSQEPFREYVIFDAKGKEIESEVFYENSSDSGAGIYARVVYKNGVRSFYDVPFKVLKSDKNYDGIYYPTKGKLVGTMEEQKDGKTKVCSSNGDYYYFEDNDNNRICYDKDKKIKYVIVGYNKEYGPNEFGAYPSVAPIKLEKYDDKGHLEDIKNGYIQLVATSSTELDYFDMDNLFGDVYINDED